MLGRIIGMDVPTFLAMSAGAGLGDKVASRITRAVRLPVAGEMAKALIGAGLSWAGERIHPLVSAFGRGMLIDAVGDFIKKVVPNPHFGSEGSPQSGEGSPQSINTPEDYIKARWGI